MVLLQLSPALRLRLEAIELILPQELSLPISRALHASSIDQLTVTATDVKESGGVLLSNNSGVGGSSENQTISHDLLVRLSRHVRSGGGETSKGVQPQLYTLSSLLAVSDIYAPPLQSRERSPELIKILAKIQLEQDVAAYSSMTSLSQPSPYRSLLPLRDDFEPKNLRNFNNNNSHSKKADQLLQIGGVGGVTGMREEWEEVRKQVGAIINVLASMMAVFTAVWWVGGGRSLAARLSLALTGSLAIGVIESFLYYRFFTRTEDRSEPVNLPTGRSENRIDNKNK